MHRDIMLFSVYMLSLVWSWRRHLLGHVYRKTAQWAKEGIAIRNFRTEFRKGGKICADEKGACKDVLFFKKNLCAAKGISKRRCRQARLEEEEGILKIFFDSSSSSPYAGREGRG